MTTRKATVLLDNRKVTFRIKRTYPKGAFAEYRISDSKGRLVGFVFDSTERSSSGKLVRSTSAHVTDVYGWRNKMDKYNIKGGPAAAFAQIISFLEGGHSRRPTQATYYC